MKNYPYYEEGWDAARLKVQEMELKRGKSYSKKQFEVNLQLQYLAALLVEGFMEMQEAEQSPESVEPTEKQ